MNYQYKHRAWDTVSATYVYWLAPVYDPMGSYWVGPPNFNLLADVVMLQKIELGESDERTELIYDFNILMYPAYPDTITIHTAHMSPISLVNDWT